MKAFRLFKIREIGQSEWNTRFAPKSVMKELQELDAYEVIPQSKSATRRYFNHLDKSSDPKITVPSYARKAKNRIDSLVRVRNNRKLKNHEVLGSLMIFRVADSDGNIIAIKIFKVWTSAMIESLILKFGDNYTLKNGVIIDPRLGKLNRNVPIVINLN